MKKFTIFDMDDEQAKALVNWFDEEGLEDLNKELVWQGLRRITLNQVSLNEDKED